VWADPHDLSVSPRVIVAPRISTMKKGIFC
jgi:hypothetical protein